MPSNPSGRTNSFVIFTQFNTHASNQTLTPEWYEHRLAMMEKLHMPTIARQTDQDFLYTLAIADDTPPEIVERLNRMLPEVGVLMPVAKEDTHYPGRNSQLFLDKNGRNTGAEILRPYMEAGKDGMVYTTLVDTDDFLANNFVSETKLRGEDTFEGFNYHGFMNFFMGYICIADTRTFHLIEDYRHFFITLREPLDGFRSVLYTTHSYVHRVAPTLMLRSNPMWVKMVHGANIGKYGGNGKTFDSDIIVKDHSHGAVAKRINLDFDAIHPYTGPHTGRDGFKEEERNNG